MMKRILPILISLIPIFASAQNDHRISSQEKLLFPNYLRQIQNNNNLNNSITSPPASPVRASAEWEEIDALMITWTSYIPILTQIVAAAHSETQVLIVCSDSNTVITTLTNAGITLTNIHYIIAPFNAIWCRDYGQWNIYTNDVDSLALIDWIYNRPRPKDDTVPAAIQNYTGLPMYATTIAPYDLIHTGGNFMCDGFGTGFSSNLILNENPSKTEAQVDTIMKLFMGIDRYIKMNTLPYDQIHHIDMHIKLLDEETLLVGEYPAGTADGPQIEANLQYILANFNSIYGTPYRVIRIPMPPDGNGDYPPSGEYRTYTNSVFVNNTVILPFYDQQYDTTAARIYREALPGYKITGIDCNSIIGALGAIHCITKEVAAADPLLISHQALHDTYNTTSPYLVNARIQHRSGIQSADLYFRTDTTLPWQSAAMTNPSSYYWSSSIPPQIAGTTVYYYIEAHSISGKSQKRPMPAPDGYWKFNVLLNNGIEAVTKSIDLGQIFPNPSHGLTCIPVSTNQPLHLKIELKNILGEKVLPVFEGMCFGDKKYFMNTEGLSKGVYVVETEAGEERFSRKLIVK